MQGFQLSRSLSAVQPTNTLHQPDQDCFNYLLAGQLFLKAAKLCLLQLQDHKFILRNQCWKKNKIIEMTLDNHLNVSWLFQ